MALTLRQKKFAALYVQYSNAYRAAKEAGYSGNNHTLRQTGYENLTKPDIREEIDRLYGDFAMGAKEVLGRLTDQARGGSEYLEVITESKIVVNAERMIEDGKAHLIKNVKYTESGQCNIEMYDAHAALVQIGRHHKLFTDKMEHDFSELTDSQLDERIAAIEGSQVTPPIRTTESAEPQGDTESGTDPDSETGAAS